MWLKDLLPDDPPLARILVFVYPSEAFNDPDLVDFQDLAGSLLRTGSSQGVTSAPDNNRT